MINDYKIIAGTLLTNSNIGGYYPTSKFSLISFGKSDYIDTVLVAEGQSIDNTIEIHKNIPKVVITTTKDRWDINSFSYDDTANQYSQLFEWCANQNEKIILMINWCDTIFLDNYRSELYDSLKEFINSSSNFMPLPGGSKVLCRNLRTCEYGTPSQFYTLSAYKFEPGKQWTKITNFERNLVGVCEPKIYRKQWKTTYFSYEMFSFTYENFKSKIEKHCEWDKTWTVNKTITDKILKKSKSIGLIKMSNKDHPQEAKELIESITKEHYGWSCFGNIND